ncbi:MAG: lactate racemase domain-containing protein, partial [Desulfitobacterium hafniense]|nr:lactate racemase domain-containing protein [Desulfitobacterium hafniense]
MLLEMSYGKEHMTAELKDDNVLGVLLPQEQAGIEKPFEAIKEAMNAPIGTNRLVDIAKEKNPSRV